ncbi:MAG: hypothetical protein ACRDPS_14950 [Nocardioides sp.]|uniref:hypothetical protein n=1 Tax=Nocardioides sp. TaxID=35761 RepID=UPI003D6C65D7
MDVVPFSVALAAGALAAFNPCGLPVLVAFLAYGLGLALVLVLLATAATLTRAGLSRWSSRLLPHVGRLTGVLLVLAAVYLAYFWIRTGFGSPSEAASDPVLGVVSDFAAWIEVQAARPWSLLVVLLVGVFVMVAGLVAFAGSRRLVIGGAALVVVGALIGFGLGDRGSDRAVPPWETADLSSRAATDSEREALRSSGKAHELADLADLGQLRELFDSDGDTTRVIAILSPSCVTCLRGAAWLQEQLADGPDADVAVYAVWLPVLGTDARTEWEDRILTDPRVHHLWDENQLVGRWFAARGYGDLPVHWDAAFVYQPTATWGYRDEPSELVAWGRPIIAHRDELGRALESQLGV